MKRLLAFLPLVLAGCHDDWESVYATCVAEGRCGTGGGGDATGGGGATTGGGMGGGGGGGEEDAGVVLLTFVGGADFGTLGTDWPTAIRTVVLRNDGTAPATGLSFAIDQNTFAISSNRCVPGDLDPGLECDLDLTLSATTPGTYSANLVATPQRGAQVSTLLAGARAGPQLAFDGPREVDFGPVVVGSTRTLSFTVRNLGLASTAPLLVSSDLPVFSPAATCTGAALDAGVACSFDVTFTPGGVSVSNAVLTASGGGLMATTSLAGAGFIPGALTVTPASWDAGLLDVGQTVMTTFTVTNTGSVPAGAVQPSLPMAPFALSGNTCTTLGPMASCQFDVSFSPTTRGVSATSILVSTPDAGSAGVSVAGAATDFVRVDLRPDGGDGTGALALVSDGGAAFTCTPTCSGLVRRGANVSVSATPAAMSIFGSFTGGTCTGTACSFTASQDAGHVVTGRFSGLWNLNVSVQGPGVAVSEDGLIRCPGTCQASNLPTGTVVRLRPSGDPSVRTLGTMDQLTGCTSTGPNVCNVTISGDTNVSLGFTRANVAFITESTWPTNLGSVTAYDTVCRNIARDAGLFEDPADGGVWVAWVSQSDGGVLARLRLPDGGSPRGWIRPDGRVVATADLFSAQLRSPIFMTERQRLLDAGVAMTGTYGDGGTSGFDCLGWSVATGSRPTLGVPSRTDEGWTAGVTGFPICAPAHLYCLEGNSRRSLVVPRRPTNSRLAFLSIASVDGTVPPAATDTICVNEARDAGLLSSNFISLRSLTDAGSAAQRVSLDGGAWHRTDGMRAVFDAQPTFAGAQPLLAPIDRNARAAAVPGNQHTWTGAPFPASNAGPSCNGWGAGMEGSARVGGASDAFGWWSIPTTVPNDPCADLNRFYCFEP